VKLLYYKGYSTTLDFNCTYVVHTWLWCVIITLILDGLFVLTWLWWLTFPELLYAVHVCCLNGYITCVVDT